MRIILYGKFQLLISLQHGTCVTLIFNFALLFVEFCRFDPDDESESSNNTTDNVDLRGKEMRFLKDKKCNNGGNHTTQGDCGAKVPIHIYEGYSVQVG